METLKHECGVAMIRLLKPLDYYRQKYGTLLYGLNKLYLLMEKQHNRGQEGAGMACVRLNVEPGEEYMFRERATGTGAITEIFAEAARRMHGEVTAESPFVGECYMGHLRYSTTSRSGLDFIHPFLRRNNWRAKNLALCGNFNLTNVDEVFAEITSRGQHSRKYADTYIMLEQVGHRLDREVERCYELCKKQNLNGLDLTHGIEEQVDLANVLRTAAPYWDGGYVMCGLTGSGESMALRDPWGIRTAFWYADDEVVVLASERPVIQTTFDVSADNIHELAPGQALLVKKDGRMRLEQVLTPGEKRACQFERIYFSRGSDVDIYPERKQMGRNLVPEILRSIDGDIDHTVFAYIPNTAEVAYYGMFEGLNDYLNGLKVKEIEALGPNATHEDIMRVLSKSIRSEKVALKDIKLRTFIAESGSRNDLAAHVYDITYGSIRSDVDNLVIIDDSIVRGTTLKESILGILGRLRPRKIVVVSSSPQIRYPDYYGIDMSSLEQFIAFRAAIALLKERGMEAVIDDVYARALAQKDLPAAEITNVVKDIYAPFRDAEISEMMVRLLKPEGFDIPVEIIFQSIEGQQQATPNHTGDWYFSGNYPTPGGYRLLNQTFIDYIENSKK